MAIKTCTPRRASIPRMPIVAAIAFVTTGISQPPPHDSGPCSPIYQPMLTHNVVGVLASVPARATPVRMSAPTASAIPIIPAVIMLVVPIRPSTVSINTARSSGRRVVPSGVCRLRGRLIPLLIVAIVVPCARRLTICVSWSCWWSRCLRVEQSRFERAQECRDGGCCGWVWRRCCLRSWCGEIMAWRPPCACARTSLNDTDSIFVWIGGYLAGIIYNTEDTSFSSILFDCLGGRVNGVGPAFIHYKGSAQIWSGMAATHNADRTSQSRLPSSRVSAALFLRPCPVDEPSCQRRPPTIWSA